MFDIYVTATCFLFPEELLDNTDDITSDTTGDKTDDTSLAI